MQGQESITAEWERFEQLRKRLTAYLKTSEGEFGGLIEALDECWNMADTMLKATSRLTECTAAAGGSQTSEIRESMMESCKVFRTSLDHIQGVGRHLHSAAKATEDLLNNSNLLQADLDPIRYIAFHFRLEGARLSADDNAAIAKVCEEMQEVLVSMKASGESQERALAAILEKLRRATQSVELASASYASLATESEERIQRNLDLVLQVPADLLDAQAKAVTLGAVVSEGIRQAVKALQGHDAIRQRLEHVLERLALVRKGEGIEPGHALVLQQQQARNVLDIIVDTGGRIQRELNAIIDAAQGVASTSRSEAASNDDAERFESAIDRLGSLTAEVNELLAGEVTVSNFVITQIAPIGELLSAKSGELEALARSMKRLALNVLIGAENMPAARGIHVLGAWTSEAAERVLNMARELNEQFAQLGESLRAQAAAITRDVQAIEACRVGLVTQRSDDALRSSRRRVNADVARLSGDAAGLRERTEVLVQSMKFVQDGTTLLRDLDDILESLLALYPKPEKELDHAAAAAGYTMLEQLSVHARVFGEDTAAGYARLTPVADGEDYGENVELF